MTYREQIQKRQEFNLEIAKWLREHDFLVVRAIAGKFEELAKQYPQQRAGQIICNYICPEYRDENPTIVTKQIMEGLFPGNPDPFFEESYETLKRLKQV